MAKHGQVLNAAKKASEVIMDHNLKARVKEDGYTRIDPALIAAAENVTLMYRPLEKLLGGFLREDNAVGIIVNVDRPKGLIHMTCAHELGHFFLNHESTADETIDYGVKAEIVEQEANYFAYALLAPKWLVASVMNQRGWTLSHLTLPAIVYQLSLRLGISFTAMIWSLSNLNLISIETRKVLLATQPKRIKEATLDGIKYSLGLNDVWLLDHNDKNQVLQPVVGDKFIFELPNHSSSGYLWTIDELRSEGFRLDPITEPAKSNKEKIGLSNLMIGGNPTLKYRLEHALMQADDNDDFEHPESLNFRNEISLNEERSWVSESDINRLNFFTEFEQVKAGLSTQEKEKRFASLKR
ncbi:ImmA/IrrE family metallo-endopeptidase [Methylobacillus caricis]|uniref:ImmA/IrrE family metallo-endopeptidase n=1 Tax=Methylobacillus caricis TaxID=1971611 RepID=UPI001CFF7C03|nr:ImmA/IrrE family metallo-endopeptidase [Methylobacillus caricis]MCB5188876.1 ImmA/IrrE family metallo-endopeptidase [Methylobacillus caricis]